MRSSEFFAEAASMTVDAVKALAECFARRSSKRRRQYASWRSGSTRGGSADIAAR